MLPTAATSLASGMLMRLCSVGIGQHQKQGLAALLPLLRAWAEPVDDHRSTAIPAHVTDPQGAPHL